MPLKVSIVILAAGKSSRFPGNKLLTRIDGEYMIEKIIRTCSKSNVDKIVVVLGHEADKIREVLEKMRDDRIMLIYNPDYELGQSMSVKVGVRQVLREVDGVMIHPADVAFITPEDINRLIEVFQITNALIVVASYRGRRGHPILFSNKIINEIMNISEEKHGLKEIVEKYWEDTVEVESSPYSVIDIDTPEDLKKIMSNL
ncbi:MAG: nucleotidyltransferase family protein [Candidatus Caldarchaeales archaeon]